MKRKAFFLLFLISFSIFVITSNQFGNAESEVNGIISTNTIWTQANSPYTLTGNILVANGATLTIESGVTVNLDSYYILVNGTIILNGNSDNRVNLQGGTLNLTAYATSWKVDGSGSIFEYVSIASTVIDSAVSLKIDSISTNATINLPNSSTIQNSIINAGSTIGNSSTITSNTINAQIAIGNSAVITENTINGKLTTGNSAIITNNIVNGSITTGSATITNNTVTGTITIKQSSSDTSAISDNTLMGGGTVWVGVMFMPEWMYNYAVYPRSVIDIEGGQTTVSDNRIFSQNLTAQVYGQPAPVSIYDGGYGITTQANSDTHILNNSITGGFYRGINLNGPSIVEANRIIGNLGGIAIGKITYDYGISVSAGNRIIQNNIIASSIVSIDSFVRNGYDGLVDYEFVIQPYTVTINNNFIIGGDTGIDLGTQTTIQNNTISNTKTALILRSSTDKSINYNNIQNYSSYSIYLNGSTANVNATYNWWGTTNTATIDQSIYDYYDDYSIGTVTYTPMLSTPVADTRTFINASANTGGSIHPNGIIVLNRGNDLSFAIIADNGYHIVDVFVNESSVGATTVYTINNIGGATTISATFAADPTPTPTTSSTSNSPSSSSSSSSKSPTPTPAVPELSLLVLLPLIAAVLMAVLLKHKNVRKPMIRSF